MPNTHEKSNNHSKQNKTMKKIQTILLSLIWISSILVASAGIKETSDKFLKAFKNADAKSMSEYYADSITFAGDPKFIDKKAMNAPISLTKGELHNSYLKLFKLVKKERWVKITSNLQPTIKTSIIGGEYKGLVKKGDFIFNLHFRKAAKGKDKGLDEAVIFIFRKINGKYLIVTHIADY